MRTSSICRWGLILGFELNPLAGISAADLVGKAIAAGLLLVPAGTTVVRFVPPLVVTEEDVEQALVAFESALLAAQKEAKTTA